MNMLKEFLFGVKVRMVEEIEIGKQWFESI